ncbi:unnamed protein product [Cochlearia groenlandica]
MNLLITILCERLVCPETKFDKFASRASPYIRLLEVLFLFKICTMALSPEALDDLKKLIAAQVTEAMTQLLPQQISQQLTLERERQAREATRVTSDSEGGSTPTPSEAMRVIRGKGVAGTSKFQAIRNLRPVNDNGPSKEPGHPTRNGPTEPELRAPRQRAPTGRNRRTRP